MALKEFVDHIQSRFGDLGGFPSLNQPPLDPTNDLNPPQIDRPALPPWLNQPDPDSLWPANIPDPWVIESEVPPPDPPFGVDQWGADVLAFYLPFHFYQHQWGIYIRASGVIYLACVLKGPARRRSTRIVDELADHEYTHLVPGDEKFLQLAELILWEHEAFHFASELAASRSEILVKRRVYNPYFSDRSAAAHEEALANAQAVTHGARKQPQAILNRLHGWMKGQGSGYRDFEQWISGWTFSQGMSRAAEFMINCIPPPQSSSAFGGFLFRGSRRYFIPTRLVNDVTQGAAGILRPFPKDYGMQAFTHSNDHRPPHIHIKRPPGSRTDTRYRWSQLTPLRGDPPLSRSGEKDLRRYVQVYGEEIQKRIQEIYGTQ